MHRQGSPYHWYDFVWCVHFGGTYMAYLALEVDQNAAVDTDFKPALLARLALAAQEAKADDYANSDVIFSQLQSDCH
jgi:hypothetical protein